MPRDIVRNCSRINLWVRVPASLRTLVLTLTLFAIKWEISTISMKQNRRRKFVLGLDLNVVVTRIRIINERIIQENNAHHLVGRMTLSRSRKTVSDVKERRITDPDNVSRILQIVRVCYTTSSFGINTEIINMPRSLPQTLTFGRGRGR